jgi:hypothetical protein
MENFEYEINTEGGKRELILNALFALRTIGHENAFDTLNNNLYDCLLLTIIKNKDASTIKLDLKGIESLRNLIEKYALESKEKSELLSQLKLANNIKHLSSCLELSMSKIDQVEKD